MPVIVIEKRHVLKRDWHIGMLNQFCPNMYETDASDYRQPRNRDKYARHDNDLKSRKILTDEVGCREIAEDHREIDCHIAQHSIAVFNNRV